MKFYGSHLCPDCEAAQAVLDEKKIPYEYVDITGSMANLKEFLRLRDSLPLYQDAREEGFVGIPSFVKDDGSITRDVEEAMS
ncbi:MAG: glutathione S-transferase N-terminal domain-containing protein [Clostridium sp.]|nr:glutathione S-transferase N-terminal domain-containing protein [Clostridium sp.]